MPRIARKDYNTSFFHIMVQGIRKEYIFKSEKNKEKYIQIMGFYLKKYNIKIIAYCIMDNHAHILVYFDKIKELYGYMKCVNTSYAMYYNRTHKNVGYVFRDRYRSEPIYSEKYLINCIHYIHDNPIKANICDDLEKYEYSSYFEYRFNEGNIIKESSKRFMDINSMFIDNIFEHREIDYSYIDYIEDIEFLNKSEVIEKYINKNKINQNEIALNKEYLKEIAKKLNKECGLTHQEIADEFGVNRLRITRLINSE